MVDRAGEVWFRWMVLGYFLLCFSVGLAVGLLLKG